MTLRDLQDYNDDRESDWSIRAKLLALWTAAAGHGADLSEGDPELSRLLETEP